MKTDIEVPLATLKPQTFLVSIEPRQAAPPHPPHPLLEQHVSIMTDEYVVTLSYNDANMLLTSDDGDRILLLAGVIYRPHGMESRQAAMQAYERLGPGFASAISGEFSLILVDRAANRVLIVTDRISARSTLHCSLNDRHFFSNSGFLLPARADQVDQTAVACFLAAGVHYNDLTFFQHVRLLRPGSVYTLHDNQLQHSAYWQYEYPPEPAHATHAQMRDKLGARLVDAVRARYPSDRPTYVSLTGGHDSRGLLGILHNRVKAEGVRCFTYALGEVQPDSDENRARQLAAVYGYPHAMVPSFHGDIVSTIVGNAVMGQGLSPVSDEIDAWRSLGAEVGASRPVMFVGDTMLMASDARVNSDDDLLVVAKIVDFRVLSWLKSFIGPSAYDALVAATTAEARRSLAHAPAQFSWMDRRDMLQFHQRQRRRYAPWREQFASPFFEVAAPILDEQVLDYVLQLPIELRFGKRLYKEAIQVIAPELTAVPIAHSASYTNFWESSFKSQFEDVAALIQSYSSPLDDLIPPDVLLRVLKMQTSPQLQRTTWVWRTSKAVYRRLRRMHLLPAASAARTARPVDPVTFLKRALVIRHYLALATQPAVKA